MRPTVPESERDTKTKIGYNINTQEALRHSRNAMEDFVEQKASKLRLEWQERISYQSKMGGEQQAEDQNEQGIWAQILMDMWGQKSSGFLLGHKYNIRLWWILDTTLRILIFNL